MTSRKNILITGAAVGFGSLIARSLVAAGHTVYATMREPTGRNASKAGSLAAFASGKSGRLHVLELDVTDEASVNAAVRRAAESEGGLDAIINNAGSGIGLGTYGEAVTMDQFRRAFDINVSGVQRVIRAALPGFRKAGSGLIVNISSIMGRLVLPYSATYTATKYAVEGLTESYRYELSGTGVDVVLVEPGGFPTEFFRSVEAPGDKPRLDSYGPLAEAPARMYAGFMEMIHGANAPDPQAVADAVLALVDAPAGQRPLRVVVDPLLGGKAPESVNRHVAEVQAGLMESIGQTSLMTLKTLD